MTGIPFPVPCPSCGGLVAKPACRCTRCGATWAEPKEMLFDGLCSASERAYKIAEFADWTNGPQAMQDVLDTLGVRRKYEIEIEKLERMERR